SSQSTQQLLSNGSDAVTQQQTDVGTLIVGRNGRLQWPDETEQDEDSHRCFPKFWQLCSLLALCLLSFTSAALVYKTAWLSQHGKACVLLGYFGGHSAASLAAVAIDRCLKFAAQPRRRSSYRVGDASLHLLSFFGGAIGTLIGMLLCCHRVKRLTFIVITLLLVPCNAFWLLLALLVLT
ncbi:hypothetical protein BOX15_Mlig005746g3, partial [Macrostomum lignano]